MQKYKMPISRLRMMVCLIGMLLPMCMFAQQITVQGVVKDQTGETVIGASVMEKGTTNGTITGIDGDFSLNIKNAKSILVISYIGYQTQELPVVTGKVMDIQMKEDAEMLDEVVVIGYGTMKKSDLTGAVSSIGNKDIKDSPVSNLGQAIQGKISGVQIVDAGKPGDNVSIKIRGLGSINNCDPLVVIDGVPTDLGLSSLNMADVERLDVLKDASATAIYGSRGANGVVMITTKRGTEGKGKLAVSANYSFQNATNVPSLLNAAQYAELSNDMMVNSGRNPNPEWANPSELGAGTDWMDELLRTGVMQNYTVSYSGGNEKSHYYVSGGFLDQSGIVKSVNYRRFTFQSNSDAQVLKWLKFSNNITFSADTKKSGSYNIGDALKALPIYPVKNEDGSWSGPDGNSEWYGSTRNPIGPTELNKSQTDGYNFLANLTAELTFTKWLKFKSTFGYDAKFWFIDNFTPKYNWKPTPTEETSRYKSDNKSFTYLWDNYFLFDHTFAEKHRVGLMAGMSAQWNTNDYLNAQKNVFMFDNVHEMDNGEEMYAIGGNETEWALLSYMARVNYSYEDRYFLTASVRRDATSKLYKDNNSGVFPAFSASWKISSEEFFEPLKNVVNLLKVRGSWGQVGNVALVPRYSWNVPLNETDWAMIYGKDLNNIVYGGVYAGSIGTKDLKWETTEQWGVGLDMGLLDNSLNLTVDYFNKRTKDLIEVVPVPSVAGISVSPYGNVGDVVNRGWEFGLSYSKKIGHVTFGVNGNLSTVHNEVLDLGNLEFMQHNVVINSLTPLRSAVGHPWYSYYVLKTEGIFQSQEEIDNFTWRDPETGIKQKVQPNAKPGDFKYVDFNNDGKITDDDKQYLGSYMPKITFGFGGNLQWKGIDFSFQFQGVGKSTVYNGFKQMGYTGRGQGGNMLADVKNSWEYNKTSGVPRIGLISDPNGNYNSLNDFFLEDASYLRLKNVTIGYTLPDNVMRAIGLPGSTARFYLNGENLFTATDYSGIDPEVGNFGIDGGTYPVARSFSIGFNFSF